MPNIPVLFHYASQRGLLGIISSKKIWATNIMYMNDATELLYAIDIAQKATKKLLPHLEGREKAFLDKFESDLEVLPEFGAKGVYISSFSEESDLLSQWRGYCSEGNGFSIGFDFNSKLSTTILRQRLKLVKCEYIPEKQIDIIVGFLTEAVKTLQQYISTDKIVEISLHNTITLLKFIETASSIKHPSFAEEKEWRLVTGPISITSDEVKYRSSKTTLVPYFEMELSDDNMPLELSEIWYWPENVLTNYSLEGLLIKNSVIGNYLIQYHGDRGEEIRIPFIKPSTIPYRPI
jgi:hypothetical protein